MGINRFGDYAETVSYGQFQVLPKGAYVVKIHSANIQENSNGQYVKIACDIAEGEYKDFYVQDYKGQQSEDKKWRCHFLLNIPKDDGTEQDGWTKRRFKTFTEALEDSNPGYHFDWDESKFKGLVIGGLFNEREYEKKDGSVGRTTNFAQVCSIASIRTGKYKIPDDKVLNHKVTVRKTNSAFMQFPEGAEELPFD